VITRDINNNELIKIHPLTYTQYSDSGYFHIEDKRTQFEYPYFPSRFNEPYNNSFDKVNLFIKIRVDTFNLPELPDETENITTIQYKFRCVNGALQDLPNVFNVLPIPRYKASLYACETDQIYDISTIHHFNINFNKLNVCDNPTCRLYKNIIAFPYLTSERLLKDTLKLKGKKIKLIPNERYDWSPYAIFQPSQKRDMFYECEIGHVFLDKTMDENDNEIITICATALNIKAHNIARSPSYRYLPPYDSFSYELTDNLAQCIWNTDEIISPGEIMGTFQLQTKVYIEPIIDLPDNLDKQKNFRLTYLKLTISKTNPQMENPITIINIVADIDTSKLYGIISMPDTFNEIYFISGICDYQIKIFNIITNRYEWVNYHEEEITIRIVKVTDMNNVKIQYGNILFNGFTSHNTYEEEFSMAIDDVLYHTEFNPMWFLRDSAYFDVIKCPKCGCYNYNVGQYGRCKSCGWTLILPY